ncbi:uracil-DNA glycosylase [Aquabacterium sp. OR-4]|uniref:uracil-DNA glycosylase n=1 Tax=Aquabacterium sp. OR-4 TaxID=2978127 RepID=UPI0021B3FE08|nr:uracil-DNA glycosylase [Aquabacterium sp. OR-4]MDT7837420.1 uracil-DNA glycosylase [Aquabacterium sp. OR-4]
MRWDERQQAMLRSLGLRLWLPPTEADAAAAAPAAASAVLADTPAAAAAVALAGSPAAAPAVAPAIPAASAPASDGAPRPLAPARPLAAAPPRQPAAPQPAGAIAGMDWPALRAAVAGCQACSLAGSRRNTVFGVGHEQAHLMVVGEAPGEQEDREGEPFVGAAGQLLDRMLAALGLGRGAADPARQVFIANTLKCRPPHNRNPQPDELAQCQGYLERQVALVQPRVILAMGRFAVQSLLGSDAPIGRLRGSVHQWQGRPLVVTYHPAYLLRQPADKARAWDDLCLAASCLQTAD